LGGGSLRTDNRLGMGEGGEGLVAFGGQEEGGEVIAERLALTALGEERIEVLSEGFERTGSGYDGQAAVMRHLLPVSLAPAHPRVNKLPLYRFL
jgi:hypothetical protein